MSQTMSESKPEHSIIASAAYLEPQKRSESPWSPTFKRLTLEVNERGGKRGANHPFVR